MTPLPQMIASPRRRVPRGPIAALAAAAVLAGTLVIAFGAASTAASGANPDVCADATRTITYDVAAFETVIPVNGWGDQVVGGMVYALQSQKAAIVANPNLTQPIVIRANVGDCIRVTLRNDIPARRVGMTADGVVSSSPLSSDGARIGNNPDTSVATGQSITYTWYAEKEGQGVVGDEANQVTDKLRPSPLTMGLYGAVIIHPQGSTWHNQITGAPLLDGTNAAVETQLFADIHAPNAPDSRSVALIMSELPAVDKTGAKPNMPDTSPPAKDATLGFNYRSEPLRNRYQAILDHRAGLTVTLPDGKVIAPADHFCDGWAPDIPTNGGVAQDPGAKCLGEESHLQSWVFGDEGKLTRVVGPGNVVTDTDNLIPKAYQGDPITYHLIHPGIEYTHPFHQHTQRWHADPGNPSSPLLDVKAVGPGESRAFVIEGGAGGLQGTVGDSIFHCHIYPHFADGFWGHLRIFDRLRDGTQQYPDGTEIQALQQLPDRVTQPAAADAAHPGYPLFVKGDFGQRAYRAPYTVISDPFQTIRRPGDTVRGPTQLEADNMPGLDPLKPGAGVVDPCPNGAPSRTYNPHALDTTITYNKAGWNDPTGRMYVEGSHLDPQTGRVPAGFKPEPYTIRARVGDCVSIHLTNDLHLDDNPSVPLDHLAKNDGVYNNDHPTSEVSTHVHLVRFDELASDGTSVGWNYSSSAMPGQTYGYRWFVDAPLRTVFFHDHQYANVHQGRGLFAAMNVEPADATWHDPATGLQTDGTGPIADIHSTSEPSFREFTLFHQDQIPMWRGAAQGGTPVNPPAQVNDFNGGSGGRAINYRNEPFENRSASDPASVFSSTVHGDPSTPVLKAYPGDPVVIRNVQGSQDSSHTFTLHGHRWRTQPDNPTSNLSDTEAINIAEWFNYVPDGGANGVPQTTVGAGSPGDYLYGSSTLDDQWLGMWGIFRVPASAVADLKELPGNAAPTNPGGPWPATAPATEGAPVAATPDPRPAGQGLDKCPATAPTRSYSVAAIQRNIVYNAANADEDPAGATFVLSADADAVLSGAMPVTPLFLRAAAGECLTVVLNNRLSPNGLPASPADVVPIDSVPFPAGNRVSLHAGMVRTDVTRDDGTTVGYNYDQTVAPGGTITYRWYVDPALEGSSINLMDFGNRIEHRHHGLYAGLLVEPAGSTWVHPTTGTPDTTGDRAVIRWTDANGAAHAVREFAVQWQDRLAILSNGAPVAKKGLGGRGINFRSERLAPRLAANNEPAFAMSSAVHGDPATPVFEAYPADPTWVRVLMSGDNIASHQFRLHGHSWASQWIAPPANAPTTTYSAQGGLMTGRAFTFVLQGGAGGVRHQSGDYLFRDGMTANGTEMGLWGLLRVRGATSAALPDLAGPAAPVGLTAAYAGGTNITLGWTDASLDETAFQIERAPASGGAFAPLATAAANATTFTDSSGSRGSAYRYRVRAHNGLADSAWSNEATAAIPLDDNSGAPGGQPPAGVPGEQPSAGAPPGVAVAGFSAAHPAVSAACVTAQGRLRAASKRLAQAKLKVRTAKSPTARRAAKALVTRRSREVKSLQAAIRRACR